MLRSSSTIITLVLLLFTGLYAADKEGDNVSPENKTAVTADVDRMLVATRAALAGEQINWQVMSSGGTDVASAGFKLMSTLGQTAVGSSGSGSFGLNHGYWQTFDSRCCCGEIRGNINCDPACQIDISDLVYLIDYMFRDGPPPCCFEEADLNCDGSIDISDLIRLIDYMFTEGPTPCRCDCAGCF